MLMYGYDIEMFANLFVVVFTDLKTRDTITFEYSIFKNEIPQLLKFLRDNDVLLVGYNNNFYDDQILYQIHKNPKITTKELKTFSNDIIEGKKYKWGKYTKWDIAKLINISIDLLVVNNYGIRSAKSTSLKKLEFNMRKLKIADLPYKHTAKITSEESIKKVIKYCEYDVENTIDFYYITAPLLKYRQQYGRSIGMNLLNTTEVEFAKRVVSKVFSKKLNISEDQFKTLRTYREEIVVKDIIDPTISFDLPENQALLKFYKDKILKATITSKKDPTKKIISLKKTIEYTINYASGLISKYGSGGIHGVVKPGVYESDDEYILLDWDYSSFYPHLIYVLGLDPKHLPTGMLGEQLMEWYTERSTKYPKATEWDMNYALKIIMNLLYGLLGSEYSNVYDVQSQLGVCVNGMLYLTKLSELVMINGGQVLYQNTDGILIRIKRTDKAKLEKIMFDYADKIKIPIEEVEVKKLVLNDVNNFLLVDINDKIKEKGVFETYDTIVSHNDYNKDTSSNIISLALTNYFVHNIPVLDTINESNNIFDYCVGVKGGSKYELMASTINPTITEMREVYDVSTDDTTYTFKVVSQQPNDHGIITNTFHDDRMLRYYPSRDGATLCKMWSEDSKSGFSFKSVEANTQVKILQNINSNKKTLYNINAEGDSIENYPTLNRAFFIDKIETIISNIENEIENEI